MTTGSPAARGRIGTAALIRGGSTAVAMLLPGSGKVGRLLRTGVVAGGYVASRQLETHRPEFLPLSVGTKDVRSEQAARYANLALGTASWVGVQTLVAHAALLVPLPKLVKALAVGAAVAKGDQVMSDRMSALGVTSALTELDTD